MAYSIGSVVFSVELASVGSVRVTPIRKDIVNHFDDHGDILGLDRIPGESNVAYRERLNDVYVHRGDTTYEGLINNLAREFGMLRQNALVIDVKRNSAGNPIASNPRVDITASEVILYSNWQSYDNYTIESTINIYDHTSSAYYLSGLVTAINESSYYSASFASGIRSNIHSATLVRGNTHRKSEEAILSGNQHLFDNSLVITGSVWFSDKNVYGTEVFVDPTTDGEYYINYNNGYVLSSSLPGGNGTCGYFYAEFPWTVDASPIQVYSLHDEEFTKKLFTQETLASGETTNALPNAEGSEIYHQLFKETNVFWGV
jgi:hypothetical protein